MFVSVQDVRDLIGGYPELNLWLAQDTDTGTDLTVRQDAVIEKYIIAMQVQMEEELHCKYDTEVIKSRVPDGTEQENDALPVGYTRWEDAYDFNASDYRRFGFLTLRRRPVLSVENVSLRYGPLANLIDFPAAWYRVNRKSGQLSIMPTPGAAWTGTQLSSGIYLLPSILGGWITDTVPQLLMVDYTVGIGEVPTGSTTGWEPHAMHLARLAARPILTQFSDLIKPGLTGESIAEDGLSQSRQFTRGGTLKYAAMINQFREDYEEFKMNHRYVSAPFMFTTV